MLDISCHAFRKDVHGLRRVRSGRSATNTTDVHLDVRRYENADAIKLWVPILLLSTWKDDA